MPETDAAQQLGKYTLKRKIATGGMAEIWVAEQTGPGGFAKELVIKRILPHLASDGRFVQMFLDEARLAAKLQHPHIVQIYDLGQAGSSYFIAMEYVRGHDLEAIIDRLAGAGRRVDPHMGARIIADACAGLDYAHRFHDEGTPLHLVHRDVSPQNILVSRDGVVKLVDFGVAKAATSSHKTQTGAVKGKFCYMSPEQINGTPLDARSDLFAMGICLYELVTGRRPFGHDSELQAVTTIVARDPDRPTALVPGLPASLEAVIMRALEKDRENRFQSAEEMQRALETFLKSSGNLVSQRDLADYLASAFGEPIDRGTQASGPALAGALGPPPPRRPGVGDGPTPMFSDVVGGLGAEHGPAGMAQGPEPGVAPGPRRAQPRTLAEATPAAAAPSGRGVGPGLILALFLVLGALGAGGYYIYDMLSKRPVEPTGDAGQVATSDAGEGDLATLRGDLGVLVATADVGVDSVGVADSNGLVGLDLGTQPGVDLSLTTDAAVPEEDAAAPEEDATVPEEDVAVPEEDVAVPEEDATVPEEDATVPEEDATVPEEDVAVPEEDVAVPEEDVAVPEEDVAVPEEDAAVPEEDVAVPEEDVAVPEEDAAVPEEDAAVPEEDAAVPEEDVAMPEEDAAVPEEDAAVPEEDAAVPEEDVAVPEEDVEAPTQDTGRERDRGRRDRGGSSNESDEPGTIVVTVTPRGRYDVFVDGERVGRDDTVRHSIAPGTYEVEVREVGGSNQYSTQVTVRPGRRARVEVEF